MTTIDVTKLSVQELLDLKNALESLETMEQESGTAKWFVDPKLSIEKYPKHRLFFALGEGYRERVFMCGNRCLPEGTLVATPKGPVPIEDVRVDDWVYDRYGNPTRVLATWDNGMQEVISLTNRGKEYLRCTPDHELDVIQLHRKRYKWDVSRNREVRKQAKDLGAEDLVKRTYVEAPLGDVLCPEAYVLGAMLGDGCCTCGSSRAVVISSADEKVPSKVASILGTTYRRAKGCYSWSIAWEGCALYNKWFRGKLCHQKVVDLDVVKTWSRESALQFVAGLIDTDGSLVHSRDGFALQFCNQSKSAVEAYSYLTLALWQECPTVAIDARARYKNGPVYVATSRNPHAITRITDELRPYLAHKYKADTTGIELIGKRSRKEAIYLSVDTEAAPSVERVYDLTVAHPEHFFLLANGLSVSNCGKSIAGAYETACHLTGIYPDWWQGRRFTKPIKAWVAGKDKTTTRDVIQKELFGGLGQFGTGMIPARCIERTWSMQGVPNGIELAKIRHISGGFSELGIKSFDRGVESFMGTAMDFIWLDEECPEDVYGECLIRTMTTGGVLITTFTPKKGLTPLLVTIGSAADMVGGERFVEMEDLKHKPSRVIVQASWDDAPHLKEEDKREILAGTPLHLREAVMKGVPTIGEGMVYPVQRSSIEYDPFEIPKHFKRWYGMDVGWNCTAAVFFAEDPDSGQVYVTHEYRGERAEPVIHASAIKRLGGDWMMGAIDPASHDRSKDDGRKLINIYRDYGLTVINANNAVNTGIAAVWEALSTGKLKIARHCNGIFREQMVYRVENGQIKKTNDHLMDALRYGYNTRQIGATKESRQRSSGGSYSMKVF